MRPSAITAGKRSTSGLSGPLLALPGLGDHGPPGLPTLGHDLVGAGPGPEPDQGRTYVLSLWLPAAGPVAGGWQLAEWEGPDASVRRWKGLPVSPEVERLAEAMAGAEATIGPCSWTQRDPVSVGPWRVISAVGRPTGIRSGSARADAPSSHLKES